MPLEICTCTSTGTASMPEKAKVRTRAIVAAEAARSGRVVLTGEGPPVYPRMMNVMVKQTLAWLPGVPI